VRGGRRALGVGAGAGIGGAGADRLKVELAAEAERVGGKLGLAGGEARGKHLAGEEGGAVGEEIREGADDAFNKAQIRLGSESMAALVEGAGDGLGIREQSEMQDRQQRTRVAIRKRLLVH
jgi:hypothetical protein